MCSKDTAQRLEVERDISNDISKKGVRPDYGEDWRWFAGVLGYSVLTPCPELVSLMKAFALTQATPTCPDSYSRCIKVVR